MHAPGCIRSSAMAALSIGAIVAAAATTTFTAAADEIHVGYFQNIGPGQIHYEGDYGAFISSSYLEDRYTQITIDLSALLSSIDAQAFNAVWVKDRGDNVYTTTPGADIDLFRLDNLSGSIEYEFSYDGPTEVHQDETEAQLRSRVAMLDWGNGGSGLEAGTFVSLGQEGILRADLSGSQIIGGSSNGDGPGGPPVLLQMSEAGNNERFHIYIQTVTVPAPGALVILAVAGALVTARRRRKLM